MNFFESVAFFKFIPAKMAGDISFLLVFLALCLVLGLYLGRSQLVSLVIYGYVGVALMTVFPSSFFDFSAYGKAIVFLAIFLFLFFVGDYLFDIHISNAGADFFWRILIMSFLAVGMLTSIVLTLLPKADVTKHLSPASSGYFVSPTAQVAWMVVPLLYLLFVNKRLR